MPVRAAQLPANVIDYVVHHSPQTPKKATVPILTKEDTFDLSSEIYSDH
jgi:hypothetical protein